VRLRSTGLGKTEIEGKVIDVKKVDDVVIFYVDIIKPVKWKTRMAFQQNDLRGLFFAVLKPKNLWYITRAFFSNQEKVHRTETF